jgi:hypothetical protein
MGFLKSDLLLFGVLSSRTYSILCFQSSFHQPSSTNGLPISVWDDFYFFCEWVYNRVLTILIYFSPFLKIENLISLKIAVFWVVAPCSLVEVYQRFRGPCCLHQLLPDYTALQPRIQQSSYSPPWEPQILLNFPALFLLCFTYIILFLFAFSLFRPLCHSDVSCPILVNVFACFFSYFRWLSTNRALNSLMSVFLFVVLALLHHHISASGPSVYHNIPASQHNELAGPQIIEGRGRGQFLFLVLISSPLCCPQSGSDWRWLHTPQGGLYSTASDAVEIVNSASVHIR